MELTGIVKEHLINPMTGDYFVHYAAVGLIENNTDYGFMRGNFALVEVYDGENWRVLPDSYFGASEGIHISPWSKSVFAVILPSSISLSCGHELYRIRMPIFQFLFNESLQDLEQFTYDVVAEFFWPANDEFLTFPVFPN